MDKEGVRGPHDTSRATFSASSPPVCAQSLSRVRLFVAPWTTAHQAPLSMGFSRQEYWSGLPFPTRDLPNPGMEPEFPKLAGWFSVTSTTWEVDLLLPPAKLWTFSSMHQICLNSTQLSAISSSFNYLKSVLLKPPHPQRWNKCPSSRVPQSPCFIIASSHHNLEFFFCIFQDHDFCEGKGCIAHASDTKPLKCCPVRSWDQNKTRERTDEWTPWQSFPSSVHKVTHRFTKFMTF